MSTSFEINKPIDAHLHLREGQTLAAVLPYTLRQFSGAVIMPNLKPPVTTVSEAKIYRQSILNLLPDHEKNFQPYLSLYLTPFTTPKMIEEASQTPWICAFKLYPAGATTNSQLGIKDLEPLLPLLEQMEKLGLVLQVHGEVTEEDVDIFDREKVFVEKYLVRWQKLFPALKIVVEHITTQEAAEFVENSPVLTTAATLTAHHLLLNRNALLVGGINPHHYCLPVLKRERHRQKLLKVITQGNPQFFLGTDSAPHARSAKENACGCAGIFSAPNALEVYAEIFDSQNCLHHLENFSSSSACQFYGFAKPTQKIRLLKKDWLMPNELDLGPQQKIVPFRANTLLHWQIEIC